MLVNKQNTIRQNSEACIQVKIKICKPNTKIRTSLFVIPALLRATTVVKVIVCVDAISPPIGRYFPLLHDGEDTRSYQGRA